MLNSPLLQFLHMMLKVSACLFSASVEHLPAVSCGSSHPKVTCLSEKFQAQATLPLTFEGLWDNRIRWGIRRYCWGIVPSTCWGSIPPPSLVDT